MTGNVLAIVLLQKTVLMAEFSRKRYRLRLLEFYFQQGVKYRPAILYCNYRRTTMDLNYEMMYIVKPAEQEISKQVNAKLEKVIVDNGGRIKDVDYWGERKLAYEINGFGRGVYVLLVFKGSQTVIRELDRVAKLTDEILRHMIIRKGY